jgi:hypothetical protein
MLINSPFTRNVFLTLLFLKHSNDIRTWLNYKQKGSVCPGILCCNSRNYHPLKSLHPLCRGSLMQLYYSLQLTIIQFLRHPHCQILTLWCSFTHPKNLARRFSLLIMWMGFPWWLECNSITVTRKFSQYDFFNNFLFWSLVLDQEYFLKTWVTSAYFVFASRHIVISAQPLVIIRPKSSQVIVQTRWILFSQPVISKHLIEKCPIQLAKPSTKGQ